MTRQIDYCPALVIPGGMCFFNHEQCNYMEKKNYQECDECRSIWGRKEMQKQIDERTKQHRFNVN